MTKKGVVMVRNIFRPRFRISAKVALYSDDGAKVLVMRYAPGHYGLPGGHLEYRESPEEALRRELQEELGISIGPVTRADFFKRSYDGHSVILAFTGTVSSKIELRPPRPMYEKGVWKTRAEFEALDDISAAYKTFTLDHWPVQ